MLPQNNNVEQSTRNIACRISVQDKDKEVKSKAKVDKDCRKTVVDRIAAGYNIARGCWLRILVHKTTKRRLAAGQQAIPRPYKVEAQLCCHKITTWNKSHDQFDGVSLLRITKKKFRRMRRSTKTAARR